MRSVAPRIDGCEEATYAEEQAEYLPITVAVIPPPAGYPERGRILLTRWQLNDEDRRRIAAGEDLYVGQLNFGGPMTPLIVSVRDMYEATG